MSNQPCGRLLTSWALVIVAVFAIDRYGHLGLLAAVVPLMIAQNIRLEHDKAMYERLREKRPWQAFALVYYVALLFVAIFALTSRFRLDGLPIVYFIVLIMFPVFVAMIVTDVGRCRASRS